MFKEIVTRYQEYKKSYPTSLVIKPFHHQIKIQLKEIMLRLPNSVPARCMFRLDVRWQSLALKHGNPKIPLVFRQKWIKENVTWHGNGTMSYQTRKEFKFAPELSSGHQVSNLTKLFLSSSLTKRSNHRHK